MVTFCFLIDYSFKTPQLLFNSSPQRDEWKILTGLFDGHIKLEYFKCLSKQLAEIIRGKRSSLEEDDKVIPSPDFYFHGLLEVDNKITTLIDLETQIKVQLKTNDFKQILDNWIKFVEINTTAFSSASPYLQ